MSGADLISDILFILQSSQLKKGFFDELAFHNYQAFRL